MKNYAIPITYKLAKSLKLKVSYLEVREALENHPVRNSMLSISDTLKNWRIDNVIIYLTDELLSRINQFPMPFITFLNENDGELVLVNGCSEGYIDYYSPASGSLRMSHQRFRQKHAGAALVIIDYTKFNNSNYRVKRVEEIFILGIRYALPALVSFSFIYLLISYQAPIPFYTLFFIKLIGLCIATMLLLRKHEFANNAIKRICHGEDGDCEGLLNSPNSILFSIIDWSVLGVIYFAGGVLLIASSMNSVSVAVSILSFFNILTILFTFYSLGYQFKKKVWCRFCLAIVLLFWLELLNFQFLDSSYSTMSTFNIVALAKGTFAFGSISFFLFILHPIFRRAAEFSQIKDQLSEYKFDHNVFTSILQNQSKFTPLSEEKKIVYLENPGSNYEITLVISTSCPACKDLYTDLDNLFLKKNSKVNINLILKIPEDSSNTTKVVGMALMYLYEKEGVEAFKGALKRWFEDPYESNAWIRQHYDKAQKDGFSSQVSARQNLWLDQNKIDYTPLIIFNGYELPKMYSLKDLQVFVE